MSSDLFEFVDYRQLLRHSLLAKKERHGRAFTFEKLANACRIQKAYLSKILGGEGHLSEDQAYLAAGFLGFTTDERRYLLLLLGVERSIVEARRKEMRAELETMRRQRMQTGAHLVASSSTVTTSELADYYLEPNMQLLHMFMTVERYQRSPSTAAAALGLSLAQVSEYLERLVKAGILEFKDGRFNVIRDDLHLPPQGTIYAAYRLLIRARAAARMMTAPSSSDYHFAVFFSSDANTRLEVQRRFLAFIKDTQALVANSETREVFQLNFDLIKWSED